MFASKTNIILALIVVAGLLFVLSLQIVPVQIYDGDKHSYAEAFNDDLTGLPVNEQATVEAGLAALHSDGSPITAGNFQPRTDVPHTLEWAGIRDQGIIDKFSQVNTFGVEGQNGCVSSGMTTEKGFLCLTPELIKLLKTRGGNASYE